MTSWFYVFSSPMITPMTNGISPPHSTKRTIYRHGRYRFLHGASVSYFFFPFKISFPLQ